jgi:hypothetical protein
MGRLNTLLEMHSYCRPAGSQTEKAFIAAFISNLPNAEQDECGNWHVTVDDSPILWSCHTDTVHNAEGRQEINYAPKSGRISLPKSSKSNCLGADDTAGVFLCREMILAKVPGHYVFHYGEERGGIGSSALARMHPDWLAQFQCAIALDRAGTADIITEQNGGCTASDAFAWSLAAKLGKRFKPCPWGMYTDTAEYSHLIPECTNVSVGYSDAHSYKEALDSKFLFRLLAALLTVRFEDLMIERNPEDDELWGINGNVLDDDGNLTGDEYDYYLDKEYADVQRVLQHDLTVKTVNGTKADDTAIWWDKYIESKKNIRVAEGQLASEPNVVVKYRK